MKKGNVLLGNTFPSLISAVRTLFAVKTAIVAKDSGAFSVFFTQPKGEYGSHGQEADNS
jgi:hypothetical protein